MDPDQSDMHWLRELPVIPFYLPNEDAYQDYKRDCESHLKQLYAADQSLKNVVPLEVAKGILRANIIKRREHAADVQTLTAAYPGAVAASELGLVAAAHLDRLTADAAVPSMELEARITVGENRSFLDRTLADHTTADMVDFMNTNDLAASLQDAIRATQSIKLSRISRQAWHDQPAQYAVIKSKTESSKTVAVEREGHPAGRFQVIGRQTSMLWLAEMSRSTVGLLKRLSSEVSNDNKASVGAIKQETIAALKGEAALVHPVIERAYVRRIIEPTDEPSS